MCVHLIRFLLHVLSLEPSSYHNSHRKRELNEEKRSFIFCIHFNWKPLKFRKPNLRRCGCGGRRSFNLAFFPEILFVLPHCQIWIWSSDYVLTKKESTFKVIIFVRQCVKINLNLQMLLFYWSPVWIDFHALIHKKDKF